MTFVGMGVAKDQEREAETRPAIQGIVPLVGFLAVIQDHATGGKRTGSADSANPARTSTLARMVSPTLVRPSVT